MSHGVNVAGFDNLVPFDCAAGAVVAEDRTGCVGEVGFGVVSGYPGITTPEVLD